ncbi:quinone oxidoreductase-like protein 1 [Neosynchiropus ocellatus]
MKGLFYQADVTEPDFVSEELRVPDAVNDHHVRVLVKACGLRPVDTQLLADVGVQKPLIPVGREVVGVVLQVGPNVTFLQPNDEVAGLLPLDSSYSGLCGVIDIEEQYLVQKPAKLPSATVASALQDGLCAYMALHMHAHVAAGQTLLVIDGASPLGLMCIQLACYHSVKVLTTSRSPQDHDFLQQLRPAVARVIAIHNNSSDLLSDVLEETGGIGVDVVIDAGACLQENEEVMLNPDKHDIISVLAVGGHWVTAHQDLQLDPPDCRFLFLKSACVSFLNPEVWTAAAAQQGRFLHILKDLMDKMAAGILRPQSVEPVPFGEMLDVMKMVQSGQRRKAVVRF